MGFDLMRLSVILLVVGGLNWGSVGLMGKDLVAGLLGRGAAAKAVYVAVGLAAVFVGLRLFGFVEGFENNANMRNGNNAGMMREGFMACKEGDKDCEAVAAMAKAMAK
jgi:uncharacterized membrane protein YuzA (DUF378 family)